MVGQHLAERRAADGPLTGLRHGVLEPTAHAQLLDRARPSLAARASLIAEPAHVVPLVAEQVAVARNVEARGSSAEIVLVLEALERAVGAAAELVIHEVVTELTRARSQPAGPDV